MNNLFYKALESKYKAKIDEAISILELYINKSVGVGEHPDIIEVLDQYVDMLESNTSKLEALQKLFTPAAPAKENS
jgi:hypothetical protein